GHELRPGSVANLRNSWTRRPYVVPPYSTGPFVPRQVATLVNRPGASNPLTGQCSSTTGWGVVIQVWPQVGMTHSGWPILVPIVTNASWPLNASWTPSACHI